LSGQPPRLVKTEINAAIGATTALSISRLVRADISHQSLEVSEMKRFIKAVSISVLSAILAILEVNPVEAVPIQTVLPPEYSDLLQAQYRRPPSSRPNTLRPSRPTSRPSRNSRPSASRHSRPINWHGYHGSRSRRPGYRRRNDGWWFPAAAFTTGVVIGAAANQSRPVYRSSSPSRNSRHVSWCMNRFRSYRASDNTFQPYSGPRRQCSSPYSVH
jgi:hypothetical protein